MEKELTEWTEALLANAPVPIPTYAPDTPSRLICVDASGWGFAALHVDLASGHVQVHQEGWNQISNLQGKGSVLTEPAAVKRAIYRFISPDFDGCVLVQTDHEPLAKTGPRGYSRTWSYNEVHQALRHFKARVVFTHIEGTSNPVDALSRGAASATQDTRALAQAAKAMLPAGQLEASVRPFGAPYGRR